jgi:hypothetical protein
MTGLGHAKAAFGATLRVESVSNDGEHNAWDALCKRAYTPSFAGKSLDDNLFNLLAFPDSHWNPLSKSNLT